jgi:hypothetical protein
VTRLTKALNKGKSSSAIITNFLYLLAAGQKMPIELIPGAAFYSYR